MMTLSPTDNQSQTTASSPSLNLRARCRLPELMDDPNLDPQLHEQALKGLGRLNFVSRSAQIVWPVIRDAAREVHTRRLRVLDIACGGADVLFRLRRYASKAGLPIELTGCDISPKAISLANEKAIQLEYGNCSFYQADVLHDVLPETYDLVMCSLFLHHLDQTDAIRLLEVMSSQCERGLIINDLRRTRLGYVMAHVACRLFSRSPIVHVDGPLSVRAAWSDAEVLQLTEQAGLQNVCLEHRWPQRFLLTWNKS